MTAKSNEANRQVRSDTISDKRRKKEVVIEKQEQVYRDLAYYLISNSF